MLLCILVETISQLEWCRGLFRPLLCKRRFFCLDDIN